MTNLKEYIVTLHNREDLEEFYKDMEILRATAYNCMPERTVDCINRRPISRNTHYSMTAEEAETLRKDPRVLAVELRPEELGMVIRKNWTQTSSSWNKSVTTNASYKNWGLLRCIEGNQITNWGSDGVQNQSATIRLNEEGRNVDVVIVDGHINPAHPEFAVNEDGTGGSRVIQFDWHTLTPTVTSLDDDAASPLTSTYVYTPYTGGDDEDDNNHGCHVAGTVAGNTHGWARSANIYNISPYSTNPNGLDELALFDYIRAFHRNKFNGRTHTVTNSGSSSYQVDGSGTNPSISLQRGLTYTFNINSSGHPFWIKTAQVTGTGSAYNTGVTNNGTAVGTITFQVPLDAPDTLYYICQFHGSMTGVFNITGSGRKNPTVCNHSWGYGYQFNLSTFPVSSITYRGSIINGPFTDAQLREYGIYAVGGVLYAPSEYSALDADAEDAIADGIIMVAAASNDYTKVDVPGGQDYNNKFILSLGADEFGSVFYHRGSSPGKCINSICVGSVDVTSTEYKANYSNCGPRVDIFAPGTRIISSTNSGGVSDPRGTGFINKYSGTSMASPQVAGAIACLLEQNPHWNQSQVKSYILEISKVNQLTDTAGGFTDYTSLQGGANQYLYVKKLRPDDGLMIPRTTQGSRPVSGLAFPRSKIYRSL